MSSMVLALRGPLLRSRSLSLIVRSSGAVFVAIMSRCRSSGGDGGGGGGGSIV